MDSEKIKSLLRSLIIASAGLVGGWFAAKGWFTTEQISAVLSSPVFAALVTMVAGAIWGIFNKTERNMVAAVDALAKDPSSPVKGVIVANTPAGKELANSIPGATVVPAGTAAADKIAA